jgi:2-polyprenyl-3-methyl-5-hydroxy-6-metoxy-1,4-benzoquinol methylase
MARVAKVETEHAITSMLDAYRDNSWMINENWPLNEPHVRLMISDVMARFPPCSESRLFDVGCGNGFVSLLFQQLGYHVTGSDAWELQERQAVFEKSGIEFVYSNFNELRPFRDLMSNSFDIVIIAQVIEHILNHPLGLMNDLARLMRPGGLLILTTPNPATVMSAVRSLRGKSLLWGTDDFINEPKIEAQRIITKGDIHYREYTHDELRQLITNAGLSVEKSLYLGLGAARSQSVFKQRIKRNRITQKLMSKRLFASNHYFLGRK